MTNSMILPNIVSIKNTKKILSNITDEFKKRNEKILEEAYHYKRVEMKKLYKNKCIQIMSLICQDIGCKLLQFARPIKYKTDEKIFDSGHYLTGDFSYTEGNIGILYEYSDTKQKFEKIQGNFKADTYQNHDRPIPLDILRKIPDPKFLTNATLITEIVDMPSEYTFTDTKEKIKPRKPDPFLVFKIPSLTDFVIHSNNEEIIVEKIRDCNLVLEDDHNIPSGYKLTRAISILNWI